MKVGKAGKAGPHAAYIAREGQYANRLEHGERLEATEAGNMPAWAEGQPQAFWLAADAFERSNGTTYREMEIALPRELDTAQRIELAREWVSQEIGDRHAYQWAIHVPTAADGGEQPHLHLMFSERQRDGIERDPEQYFKRYNAKSPEKGGARKGYGPSAGQTLTKAARAAELKALRLRWADTCNRHLSQAGQEVRIDMRSHAERGTGLEAEAKQLPSQWRDLEQRAQVIEFRAAKADQVAAAGALARHVPDVRGELVNLAAERERRELARRMVPEPLPDVAPAQIHDLAAEREQRGLPAVEQAVPAKRENEAQRVERLLAEAAAAKRQWDDLVRERQAIQQRQDKGEPAYVAAVVKLGREAWDARSALDVARKDQARDEQRMAAKPNPLTDLATRLGHRLKVAQAERKERQARKAFTQHPDYKRARAWNERNKADQARLARPEGRDAPQIDLEISEARARAEAAQRVADRAAADPRELVRQMDAALLDRKNALAELPRDALADRQLAHDRETVRALRQQIDQPDRPSAEALAEILERHQMQARHWQGVAEGVTRERTRRLLQERLRAQQALREAVEREQGIEDAQGYELARIEREERRIEQLLVDVDGFDQGKPKPLPALAEERQRLDQDRRRLEEVPSWAEEARAEAEQAQQHRPSPFRPW